MTQKNEIIEWVGRGNTNPAVLGSMIDGLESGSGSAIGNTVNLSTDIVGQQIIIKGPFFDPRGVYSEILGAVHDNPGSGHALCMAGR